MGTRPRSRWPWYLCSIIICVIAIRIIFNISAGKKINEEDVYYPPTPPPPDVEGTLWGGTGAVADWHKELIALMKKDIRAGLEGRKPDLSGMVLIPGGKAIIGAEDHPHGNEQRLPLQTVDLGPFYIDANEVTNAQYELCVKDKQCIPNGNCGHITDCKTADRPALLTFYKAQRYCYWAGKRLPTELEWEKAARGTEGRKYPWGNSEPTEKHGNICGSECSASTTMPDWEDGFEYTSPVGVFPEGDSPYGLQDVAGNVKEWVTAESGLAGNQKIARGGSWYSQRVEMYTYYRQVWVPGVRLDDKGVRCAADPIIK